MIGNDVVIHENCKLPRSVRIGNHVAIDSGFYCTPKLCVGNYVHISPHVAIIGGKQSVCTIGSYCFVSVGAKLVCGSEKFMGNGLIGPIIPDAFRDELDLRGVVMENFSGVCAQGVLLPGAHLSEGSILGANSFLKTKTEPWTIYAGNPAKPIKKRPFEIMKNYAKLLEHNHD